MITWHNCYKGSWSNKITPESFSHPAKYSRNLIARIYRYALKKGYLKPGFTVLDPFGGVALGAIDALPNGINWVGVELEPRFVDMGAGCNCPGLSKADWVRFYGRWEQANHTAGRRWCPQCVAQAKKVLPPPAPQMKLFTAIDPRAAYIRNSGKIPSTPPHHYEGNLAHFRRYAKGGATAILLQGDSRQLAQVVLSHANGIISSPPYANNSKGDYTKACRDNNNQGQGCFRNFYGHTQGQIAKLPVGSHTAVISSPPYAGIRIAKIGGKDYLSSLRRSSSSERYGATEGQVGTLSEGDYQAVIGSPPFEDALPRIHVEKSDRVATARSLGISNAEHISPIDCQAQNGSYGYQPGQLGAMRGGFNAAISSPLYGNGTVTDRNGIDPIRFKKHGRNSQAVTMNGYGHSPGQLNHVRTETFWSAAWQIVEQCYLLLPPGGVAIWVCKDFVRNSQRVPFCDMWTQLCESTGFEHLETIRAMLVTEKAQQWTLNGGVVQLRSEHKSFFRRLAEKNGSPRIDWEEVIILQKPY